MKRLPFLIVLLLIAAAGVYFLRHRPQNSEPSGYPGYGEGELVYLSAPIGGELDKLNVVRGDQAKRDAPMFTLEREQEQAARAEAGEMLRESKAQYDKAALDFGRAKSLRDKRVIASEQYDADEQALRSAEATVAARQRVLEQADWRYRQKEQSAPADSLVYDTYFRPGEWVPAGSPVLSLLPPEYMKVRFFVPQPDLGKVQVGAPIEILVDGQPRPLSGTVSFVSPQAEYTLPIIYSRENRGKLVFLVEGKLALEDAPKLHPGSPVEVRLKPMTSDQ